MSRIASCKVARRISDETHTFLSAFAKLCLRESSAPARRWMEFTGVDSDHLHALQNEAVPGGVSTAAASSQSDHFLVGFTPVKPVPA